MESRDYTGGFENFLQEKSDQYKLYPSDKVWNAINGKLHPRKNWSYLFVAAIFIGLGIGGKVHDSSFLKGFEQATDIENYSNTELADIASVVPISAAPSLKRSSATPSNQTGIISESLASKGAAGRSLPSAVSEKLFTSKGGASPSLQQVVSEDLTEKADNTAPASTLANELTRVILADEVHQLTEGTSESMPTENASAAASATEKANAPSPAGVTPSATEKANTASPAGVTPSAAEKANAASLAGVTSSATEKANAASLAGVTSSATEKANAASTSAGVAGAATEKTNAAPTSTGNLPVEQTNPTIAEEANSGEESFVELSDYHHRINAFATVPTAAAGLGAKDITATHLAAPQKAASIKVLKPRHLNLGWQLYFSPTVSYRKLSGEGMKYFNGYMAASSPDVNKSVTHKPSIGFEIGTALTFATGRNFRLKSGVQLNINQYEVQAFYFTPEVAPLTRGGIGHTEINVISRYRNFDGFSKTWLRNKHIMMAVPLGAELTVLGNEKVKFNIAGTLQPTFVLNNQAYMISTNMKNYAQAPSLYRNFNVAAGAEAYLSIKAGSYRWMIGPQFRYQIFSSYKKEYPITEYLIDYGFKIGITR